MRIINGRGGECESEHQGFLELALGGYDVAFYNQR